MRDWLTHLSWVVRQSWPNGTGLDFYPSGRMTVAPRVVVLHSTETTTFPGYNRGAANPHFTIDLRTGETRQHVPLSWGSRCLAVSTAGVTDRTVNITGTIQIEMIGAVTPGYPRAYGHYDLPGGFPSDEKAQRNLARLLRAIHDETGIPLRASSYARWVTYPASYGVRAPQRLSSAQFRDARGVLGHQHAVANDHGDGLPGRSSNGAAPDLDATLALASGVVLDVEPDFPAGPNPDNNFGFPADHVRAVQAALNNYAALGLITLTEPLEVDGSLGAKTTTAVRALQVALGFPPEEQDGLPGPRTTTAMEDIMTTLVQLSQQMKDLDNTVRAQNEKLLATTFKGAGGARLDDILVATWRKAGTVDTAALAAALQNVPGGTSVDPDALADAIADELAHRLTGTANKEAV